MKRVTDALLRASGSSTFFGLIVAAFFVSGLAIALTAKDQLYDEFWHFDIIKIYSTHLTPFISRQSPNDALVGDITRYGSYLYHYLLSWPYRWMHTAGVSDQNAEIVLRVITLAMPTAALFWFRRILHDLGVGRATANVALLLYAAVPVSTFVGETINYDNLMQLLGAIFLSLALRAWLDPRRSVAFYATMFALGGFGSLTKFEFTPVFATVFVAIVVRWLLWRRRERAAWLPELRWASTPDRARTAGGLLAFAVSLALLFERYGLNLVRYHATEPSCTTVHTAKFCSAYGVWERNYQFGLAHPNRTPLGVDVLASYVVRWFTGTVGTMPVVGGVAGTGKGAPITLLLIQLGAVIALIVLLLTLGIVFRRTGFRFLAMPAIVYGVALFATDLNFYLKYNVPAAIQSRYWLLFLPLILGAVGFGLSRLISRLYPGRQVGLKLLLLLLILIAITQGGFFTTFMVAAAPDWFITNGPFAHSVLPFFRGIAAHLVAVHPLP